MGICLNDCWMKHNKYWCWPLSPKWILCLMTFGLHVFAGPVCHEGFALHLIRWKVARPLVFRRISCLNIFESKSISLQMMFYYQFTEATAMNLMSIDLYVFVFEHQYRPAKYGSAERVTGST